jgi:hypothetical protein
MQAPPEQMHFPQFLSSMQTPPGNMKWVLSSPLLVIVKTKNWYREETDLWAEFGKSTIRQEVFLKEFGKRRLRSGVRHHSAEELFHAWKKKHSIMHDDVA